MKRATKITAVVVAVVVAGGATVLGLVGGSGNPSNQQTTVAADAQQVESKCGLAGTTGSPTTLPAKWEDVSGFYLPVSATDGPGLRTDGASWSCYAHTPTGAVLAGAIIPMLAAGVATDWQTVVREQTVPGPGQTVLLDSVPSPTTETPTLKGFSIAAYSDDHATINYYLPTASRQFSCTVDVVWYENDWRLQLGADGSTSTGCTEGVPASFVPWGP